MKKLIFAIMLLCILLLSGCGGDDLTQGLDLPFEESDIQQIQLFYYTGDPSEAQQKTVTGNEDIHYIYNMLSAEIQLKTNAISLPDSYDTLRIRFCLKDGHGYSMQYDGYGVKDGILSSNDGDFTYFTPSDVAWLWHQLTSEYETTPIALAPVGATEVPQRVE